jgi:hypothetical protein
VRVGEEQETRGHGPTLSLPRTAGAGPPPLP